MLSEVDDGSTPYSKLKRYHADLEETFWLMTKQAVVERQQPILTPDDSFKLFRVFCMLADRNHSKNGSIQVRLNQIHKFEDLKHFKTVLNKLNDIQMTHYCLVRYVSPFNSIR